MHIWIDQCIYVCAGILCNAILLNSVKLNFVIIFSPESRACSTDSAGSSLSIEGDGMGMGDVSWEGGTEKYGHSLTPDEPVILEENPDECDNVRWPPCK